MRKCKVLKDADKTIVWDKAFKQTIGTNYLGRKKYMNQYEKNPKDMLLNEKRNI